MKHLAWITGSLTLAACLTPGAAHAAPFCIQNQILQPQCIYYDPRECQAEANRQNATCAPNVAEARLSRAHGDYCVVTSTGIPLCVYADYQTCSTAAAQQRGACVQAQPNIPAQQPNPYSAINGQ
jgi:hypothetical protein